MRSEREKFNDRVKECANDVCGMRGVSGPEEKWECASEGDGGRK